MERQPGETAVPGASARLAVTRIRGNERDDGNASRVGRVQTPFSGAVWQTFAGERGVPGCPGPCVRKTCPIWKQVECQSQEAIRIRECYWTQITYFQLLATRTF